MNTIIFPFKSITSEFLKGQKVRMKDDRNDIYSVELLDKKLVAQEKSNNLFYFLIQCNNYCMVSQFRVFVDNNKSAIANVQDMVCYEIPYSDAYEEIVSSYETFVGSKCDYNYLNNYIDNNYKYIDDSYTKSKSKREWEKQLAFAAQNPVSSQSTNVPTKKSTKESVPSLLKIKMDLDIICKIYYNTTSEMEKAQGAGGYITDYEYLNYECKDIIKELVEFVFKSNSSISEIHRKFLEIKYAEGWEYAESYNDYSKTDPKMSEKASELQMVQYTFLQSLTNIFELNG